MNMNLFLQVWISKPFKTDVVYISISFMYKRACISIRPSWIDPEHITSNRLKNVHSKVSTFISWEQDKRRERERERDRERERLEFNSLQSFSLVILLLLYASICNCWNISKLNNHIKQSEERDIYCTKFLKIKIWLHCSINAQITEKNTLIVN